MSRGLELDVEEELGVPAGGGDEPVPFKRPLGRFARTFLQRTSLKVVQPPLTVWDSFRRAMTAMAMILVFLHMRHSLRGRCMSPCSTQAEMIALVTVGACT